MATVSTALKMFDQMTRPLQQVTQALNLTISAMDNMNNSANRDIRITNSLNTARESIQRAGVGLQELAREQDRARSNQDNLNNSFNRGINSSDGLTSKIKGLVGAYLGFQTVKKGLDATIGGAANLERQLITISGMLGNKNIGRAFFDKINDYALISQYGLKNFAAISRQFIQFTKNTDKLMDLNKLSERLAFLDPTQGLEGAGFALKEILGGDGMSLKGRFGFSSSEIKTLKEASGMDDFMKKFDEMLNKKGGTKLAVEEAAGAAISLWDNLIANVQTSFSKAGNNALETLKPLLKALNEGFKAGKFQSFFDGLANGLVTVVNAGVRLFNMIQSIGSSIQNNWGIVGPILAGAIGAIVTLKGTMIAYNIVQGISKGIQLASAIATAIHTKTTLAKANADAAATATQWGLNAALLACPLMWIVIGIVAVIAAIVAWSIHTNGLKVTWLMFTNYLLTAWDSIKINAVMLANKVINCWDSILIGSARLNIGVQNALGNMKAGGLMILQNFVNGAIDLINDLIKCVNKIPGVSIEAIDKVTFGTEAMAENELAKLARNKVLSDYIAEKDAAKKVRQDNLDNMINKANADLAKRQADIAAARKEHINSSANGSNTSNLNNIMDKWNKAQGPGTLGMDDPNKKLKKGNKHLKNIDDKIDISNEHLEMLRDLAEQESIQNFTTLSPTVQITTGDIKEEADINKIIDKIESYMENELVNSAEGVYA
ncbi:hypothetical protein DP144_00095 [Clostridium tetani]|uniref:hypothetical protein n=1 Tax=Clostridium tetani TaxID=1513 RepID=UPI00100B197D|nr:hypothetical protein [Clostridium tetani]RXM79250.1 hypothetical protein DP154_00095 [Clostridium tetani]RYV00062.1 hypothetical protein DP144_00095 [Clostridium tetani]